jgi:hypothetical protein
MVWGVQNLAGNPFVGSFTYIMQQARIFTGKSTTLGQYGIDMAGVSGA